MTSTRKKKRSLSSLAIAPTTRKAGTSGAKAVPKMPGKSQEIKRRLENGKDKIEEKSHLGQSSSLKCSTKLPIVYKKQAGPSQVAHTMDGPSTNLETSFNGKDKHVNWEGLSVLAETANRKDELNVPLLGLPAFDSETKDKLNMINAKDLKRGARESISNKRNNIVDLNKSLIPEEIPEPTPNGATEFIDSREKRVAASAANGFTDKSLRRLYPIWFTLRACQAKKGDPYPQIPKPYIRIKDGNLPVSYVSKYIVQKLNLKHDSEVELMCCDQTLVPSATLNSLVDMWVRFTSNTDGLIGRSNSDADKFVMVLTYRRK
ncbi:hypothetical protein BVC80_8773g15 [Macleaya cordata]|uniref:E3 ubiquitin protein ligase DRIP2-like n=1 Tax=Macleaya cordata TaxID=56857 RepID=A0A200QSG0_MACCD|nr:hypothetical protein BVC80_8773g15 [Macleaya cordata]